MAAGCSSGDARETARPPWDAASSDASTPAPLEMPGAMGTSALTTPPFNASDFARELSELFTAAASEVARAREQADIDAGFPTAASTLLEESAGELRRVADAGYEALEDELLDAYLQYIERAGPSEDNIRLGESMEYVLGRDIVSYHKLNSSELNEMKKEFWRKELDVLTDRLAAERSRFTLSKESLVVAKKASIGDDQKDVVAWLDENLVKLADGYASRVKAAVDAAVEESGFTPLVKRCGGIEIDEEVTGLENDFAKDYERVKKITGG